MASMRHAAIRAALDTMYFTGTHHVARPFLGGLGAILMFHRVRPPGSASFQPNHFLEITPDFLQQVIGNLRKHDIDIVSLDEACRRVDDGGSERRFAVLTFDDAYRDNLEYAWPILQREGTPFTVYVSSAFADGEGRLWWLGLEEAIAANNRLELSIDGLKVALDCSDDAAKHDAYRTLVAMMYASPGATIAAAREIETRYGFDFEAHCRAECMNWDELAHMAESPLMTIGAHTISHPILAHLSLKDVETELTVSRKRIADKLGTSPVHLAYPHGGPGEAGSREFEMAASLGYRSAVTTRPGLLFADHTGHMTALPRISVNGEFQHLRYLDVLLSGAPTTLKNRFRRVNAA